MMVRSGGCLCGNVRYHVSGEPLRSGLCHCADCRRESGSVFTAFAIWPRPAFEYEGDIATFSGRSFCPACGSRLFCLTEDKAEIRLGSLDDAPMEILPEYEVWTKRRESWLPAIAGADQHREDA